MKHSTATPTKSEQARFAKLYELGCVACRINAEVKGETFDPREYEYAHLHHYLRGNKRIGHEATVPLCAWHHTGVAYDGVPSEWFLKTLGPSFHRHAREFRNRYGDDALLLARVNSLIDNNGEQQ